MGYIFISYSHKDKPIALSIKKRLEAAGFDVWMDVDSIPPSMVWESKIKEALYKARAMVILLSEASRVSKYVQKEFEIARQRDSRDLPIYPLIIHGAVESVIPDYVEEIQVLGKEDISLDKRTDQLIKVLNKDIGRSHWLKPYRKLILLVTVIGLLLLAVAGLLLRPTTVEQQHLPDVSLTSLLYASDGFDPRLLDLRTAEDDGIPLRPNYAFEVRNIWATASGSATGYTLQAELYAGDELIGRTPNPVALQDGVFELGAISPEKYMHGSVSTAVMVQSSWQDLSVVLTLFHNDSPVATERSVISINGNGTSWLWDAPFARMTSIVYSINDGAQMVYDPRAGAVGLDARAGDEITLHAVWYKSDAASSQGIQVEAYLTDVGYKPANISPMNDIQLGVNPLSNFVTMTWQVQPSDRFWVVYLVRDDGMVLDAYIIPLNAASSPGLISVANTVQWPFQQVTYLDFEQPADLSDWAAGRTSLLQMSTQVAFTGNSAAAITVSSVESASDPEQVVFWNRPLDANAVVGQVYWPSQPGIQVRWAQWCAWACVPIAVEPDRWNTFVMDVSELTFDDSPLLTLDIPAMWIQLVVEGVDEETPYTFYVDGIQYYPSD